MTVTNEEFDLGITSGLNGAAGNPILSPVRWPRPAQVTVLTLRSSMARIPAITAFSMGGSNQVVGTNAAISYITIVGF